METKTNKNFTYTGLGFPIQLDQVTMLKIDNEWHPKIDVKKISDIVIKELATQKDKLTGNQIKFIRTYFSMSLRKFAKEVVHESHTAVSKWEKFGDKVTNMDTNIEMMLRLDMIERIESKSKKKREIFYEKYQELKEELYSADKNVKTIYIAA